MKSVRRSSIAESLEINIYFKYSFPSNLIELATATGFFEPGITPVTLIHFSLKDILTCS